MSKKTPRRKKRTFTYDEFGEKVTIEDQYIEITVKMAANDEDGYGKVCVAVPAAFVRWSGVPRRRLELGHVYEVEINVGNRRFRGKPLTVDIR